MSFSSPSSSSSPTGGRVRPPVAPSPAISLPDAISDAHGILGSEPLSPDSPSLDPLITALYLKLATSSRDDDIRLRAVHDLADMRGHFARARVRAEVGGGAALAALSLRPDLFAHLIRGLGDLGVVPPDAASSIEALVEEAPQESS